MDLPPGFTLTSGPGSSRGFQRLGQQMPVRFLCKRRASWRDDSRSVHRVRERMQKRHRRTRHQVQGRRSLGKKQSSPHPHGRCLPSHPGWGGGLCASQASTPALRSRRLPSAWSQPLPRRLSEKMPRHRACSLPILPEAGKSPAISPKIIYEGAFPPPRCQVWTVRLLCFGVGM